MAGPSYLSSQHSLESQCAVRKYSIFLTTPKFMEHPWACSVWVGIEPDPRPRMRPLDPNPYGTNR